MSDFIKNLKTKLEKSVAPMGYTVQLRTSKSLRIVKDKDTIMTVTDRGEMVEVVVEGKSYTYDKWYTSADQLATVITNFFAQRQ